MNMSKKNKKKRFSGTDDELIKEGFFRCNHCNELNFPHNRWCSECGKLMDWERLKPLASQPKIKHDK